MPYNWRLHLSMWDLLSFSQTSFLPVPNYGSYKNTTDSPSTQKETPLCNHGSWTSSHIRAFSCGLLHYNFLCSFRDSQFTLSFVSLYIGRVSRKENVNHFLMVIMKYWSPLSYIPETYFWHVCIDCNNLIPKFPLLLVAFLIEMIFSLCLNISDIYHSCFFIRLMGIAKKLLIFE